LTLIVEPARMTDGSGSRSDGEDVTGDGTAMFAVRMIIIPWVTDPSVTEIGLRIAIWKLNDKIMTSGNSNR